MTFEEWILIEYITRMIAIISLVAIPPYFLWRKHVGLPFWKTVYMYITRDRSI